MSRYTTEDWLYIASLQMHLHNPLSGEWLGSPVVFTYNTNVGTNSVL